MRGGKVCKCQMQPMKQQHFWEEEIETLQTESLHLCPAGLRRYSPQDLATNHLRMVDGSQFSLIPVEELFLSIHSRTSQKISALCGMETQHQRSISLSSKDITVVHIFGSRLLRWTVAWDVLCVHITPLSHHVLWMPSVWCLDVELAGWLVGSLCWPEDPPTSCGSSTNKSLVGQADVGCNMNTRCNTYGLEFSDAVLQYLIGLVWEGL